MDRLWGEFLPVPRERLRELKGGETIPAGGRTLQVAYTPGHASHHVSYFEPSTRIAFVGDTAGSVAGQGSTSCRPHRLPTSPRAMARKRGKILGWDPDTLFLTHFGPFNGARQHFHELMSRMDEWGRIARRLVGDERLTEEEREEQFVAEALLDLRRIVGVADAEQYSRAGSIAYSWQGLARYWRKRHA